MALFDICKLENFDLRNQNNLLQNDVVQLSQNFTNNLKLSMPPFNNVSFLLKLREKCLEFIFIWYFSQRKL